MHAATQRAPALRAASGAWWERQRVEGAWARGDEHVRHAAVKLGKGFESGASESEPAGRMRARVRGMLGQVMDALALPAPAGMRTQG